MKCKQGECLNVVWRRGYCSSHYLRLLRHGSPDGGMHYKKISCEHTDSDGTKFNWKHPLYNTYVGMYSRCYDPKNKKYNIYGASGVVVDNRWLGECGFHRFVEDMGPKPAEFSLDRVNGGGNYSIDNCRWASIHQQNSNKKNSNNVVGVFKANDGRKMKWRTTLVISGKEMAGKSFETEGQAIDFITNLRSRLL